MSEYGFESPAREIEEGLEETSEKGLDADLENLFTQFEEQCEHVISDPDNNESLQELLDEAREYMDASNKDRWMKLLKDTKGALMNENDPDLVADILKEAKTEAAELMAE